MASLTAGTLSPGMVGLVGGRHFYECRWLLDGREGAIVVFADAKVLDPEQLAFAARIRRIEAGLEVDRFSLDTWALTTAPDDLAWLPVVLI